MARTTGALKSKQKTESLGSQWFRWVDLCFFLFATMNHPEPDDLLTFGQLAQAIHAFRHSAVNRHPSTLWRRATQGVRAKDGTLHILQTARDGKNILSTLR